MKFKLILILVAFIFVISIVNAAQVIITPSEIITIPAVGEVNTAYDNNDLRCYVNSVIDQRAFIFGWRDNNRVINNNRIVLRSDGSILPSDLTTISHAISCVVYGGGNLIGTNNVVIQPTPSTPQPPNQHPIARAGQDKVGYVNEIVNFDGTASTDSDGNIVSYSWDFGDGSTPLENSNGITTHVYRNNRTYIVRFRVIDNNGFASDDTLTVYISNRPTPQPEPQIITITTPNTFKDYRFTIPSNEFNRNEALYTTFKVSNQNGGIADLTNNLVVKLRDVNNIHRTVALSPLTTTIGGVFNSRRIINGQEVNCSWVLPVCSVINKGYYYYKIDNIPKEDDFLGQIKLEVRLENKITNKDINILNNLPVSNGGSDVTAYVDDYVRFDSINSNDVEDEHYLNYTWYFDDGSSPNYDTITVHKYTRPGVYRPILIVTDSEGASTTSTRTIIINSRPNLPPNVTILMPVEGSQVRLNTNIMFLATARDPENGQLNYTWDFGDGRTSNLVLPTHSYVTTGLFTVTVTVSDGVNRISKSVIINVYQPLPPINLPPVINLNSPSNNSRFLINIPVLFNAIVTDPENDLLNYTWDFGDGTQVSHNLAALHNYTTQGNYIATLSVTDGRYLVSKSISLTIIDNTIPNRPPVVNIISPINNTVSLVNSFMIFNARASDPDNNQLNYTWDFGDGSNSTSRIPLIHVYRTAGTYTTTLSVSDGILSATDSITITINNPLPLINLAPIVNLLSPQNGSEYAVNIPVNFRATATDQENDLLNYTWDFGDNTQVNNNPTTLHTYRRIGDYTIKLSVSDRTHTVINNINIKIRNIIIIRGQLPTAEITLNTEDITINNPISFSGKNSIDPDGNIVSYSWDFGDGTTSNLINPINTYTKKGIYTVKLTVRDNDNNINTVTKVLDVKDFSRTSNVGRRKQTNSGSVNDVHSFNLGGITPLNNQFSYKPGDLVVLLIRINNNGNIRERLTLNLKGVNIYISNYINTFELSPSENSIQQVSFIIPQNINPGYYILQLNLDNNLDNHAVSYFQFNII